AGLGTAAPQASLSAFTLAVMDQFLAELKSNTHKKTAVLGGGFGEIRTFCLGTFRTLYRRGRLRTKNS
ncbi:MAG: hypothetical protein PHQ13_15775, partial [Rhodoferax sp.]|nr:hypothetical protein [Rhodoferax sp.]